MMVKLGARAAATGVATAMVLMCGAWVGAGQGQTLDPKDVPPSSPILEKAAAPYVHFRTDVATVEANGFNSRDAMQDAHRRLSSYQDDDMARAFVAYAALVAADNDAFARAIEKKTKRARDRSKFLNELSTDPAMVRNMPGANAAIQDILKMSAQDSTRIGSLGERFIDEAYDLQQASWARQKLRADGMARVESAANWRRSRERPALTARPILQSKSGTIRPNLTASTEWSRDWSTNAATVRENPRSGAMMTRALLVAALYATGELTESQLQSYAVSKPTNRCFKNASLNFNQCIAATRTPYEEAFCIGTHGLNDISRCVGWASGTGTPK